MTATAKVAHTAGIYSVVHADKAFARTDWAWEVWHTPSITRMSTHCSEREAKAQVRNYEAADMRRAAAEARANG